MDLQNAIRRQANGAGRGCARFLRALLRRGRCLRAAEDGSRDAAGGEVGSALIETAASLPVLFVLIFCFMELCMAFYSYDMISESAREGTRYAMLLSSTCTNSSGGSVPPVDDFVKTVFDVITVQPAENQGNQGDQGNQSDQPAAAPEAPAPPPEIAPPPPPADTPPPTIALHQTKDEVIAVMGQPARIVKLGVKEIYYYKDMKVTFTNGKVSNVE